MKAVKIACLVAGYFGVMVGAYCLGAKFGELIVKVAKS